MSNGSKYIEILEKLTLPTSLVMLRLKLWLLCSTLKSVFFPRKLDIGDYQIQMDLENSYSPDVGLAILAFSCTDTSYNSVKQIVEIAEKKSLNPNTNVQTVIIDNEGEIILDLSEYAKQLEKNESFSENVCQKIKDLIKENILAGNSIEIKYTQTATII